MAEENILDGDQLRWRNIDETRNYFMKQINQNDLMITIQKIFLWF